jgi:small-conductance mechanosensitive channel
MKCIKYTLFIFNFFFWLVGVVILGFGLYLLINPLIHKDSSFESGMEQLHSIRLTLIVLGSIIMLLGFLGCCGAILENKCMLVVFFILMTLVFLAVLVAGLLLVFMRSKTESVLLKGFEEERIKALTATDASERNKTEAIHTYLKCCGATNGTQDYVSRSLPVPEACAKYGNKSCRDRMDAKLDEYWLVGVVALFTTAFVTLVGMVFAMMLCCALRDDEYD